MYRGKYLTSMDDISDVLLVRGSISEFAPGLRDERDEMAIYALVYDEDDVPMGCGRMYIGDDSRFWLDTIGVLAEKRRLFVGDLITRMLLYRAQTLNAGSVSLRVPDDLTRYFSRYGFVAGEACEDVCGRSARRMTVAGDGIRLEGSCSHANAGCGGDCAHCAET